MKKLIFSLDNPIDENVAKEIESFASTVTNCKAEVDIQKGELIIWVSNETDIFKLQENLVAAAVANGHSMSHTPRVMDDDSVSSNETKITSRSRLNVSIGTFISVICVSIILSVLITSSIMMRRNKPTINVTNGIHTEDGVAFSELKTLDSLFKAYSYYDLNDEKIMAEVLKAYCRATGDRYAVYYTPEEFAAYQSSSTGNSIGMGIGVKSAQFICKDVTENAILITRVYADSTAEAAGVQAGDYIMYIGAGDDRKAVSSFATYSEASNSLASNVEGEKIFFTVYRMTGEETYDEIYFEVETKEMVYSAVTSFVSSTDPSVGVIRIYSFNMTTPTFFKEHMNNLIAQGITKFIFDLRDNPGGDLKSIEAVLSYFLNEGDLMISTESKSQADAKDVVEVRYYTGSYSSCSVSVDEIGQYKGFSYVVLVNEATASAAELFTATFRDYNLAPIVGVKTYGKGSMQFLYDLAPYGIQGGLKMTTRHYFPPCGVGYDGIGIFPTEGCEVTMDSAYATTPVVLVPEAKDTQLQKAITVVNTNS